MCAASPHTRANADRQVELDIGKGIAVFLMVCVHVQEMYSRAEVQHSLFGYAVELLTTFPAAPLFMFVMGVSMVYSRRQDAGHALSRGGLLLLAAYVLNALRGYIPFFLGLKTGLLAEETIPYGDVLLSLLEVDILHFAGLTFILVGGLRAAKVPWGVYPIVGVLLGALNYVVRGVNTGQPVIDSFLGLFWGTGDTSYFPFLSWAFYPLAGVAFGAVLRRTADKRGLYLKTLLVGCAAFLITAWVAGFGPLHYLGIPEPYAYYHQDLIGNAINASLMLVWLSILYLLRGAFPVVILKRLLFWGRELTPIYMIHWVLIGWFSLLVGLYQLYLWQSILAMVVIIVAADRITAAYARRRESRRAPKAPSAMTSVS